MYVKACNFGAQATLPFSEKLVACQEPAELEQKPITRKRRMRVCYPTLRGPLLLSLDIDDRPAVYFATPYDVVDNPDEECEAEHPNTPVHVSRLGPSVSDAMMK